MLLQTTVWSGLAMERDPTETLGLLSVREEVKGTREFLHDGGIQGRSSVEVRLRLHVRETDLKAGSPVRGRMKLH